jgi:hypothetical protein
LEDPLTGFLVRFPKRGTADYFDGIRAGGKDVAIAKGADRFDNLTDLIDPTEGSDWYAPQRRLDKVSETRRWIIPLVEVHEFRLAQMLRNRCDLIELKASVALQASLSTNPK